MRFRRCKLFHRNLPQDYGLYADGVSAEKININPPELSGRALTIRAVIFFLCLRENKNFSFQVKKVCTYQGKRNPRLFGTYVHTFLSSDEIFFRLNKLYFPEATGRAHLYTIFDSMCALRGLLEKANHSFLQTQRRASIACV